MVAGADLGALIAEKAAEKGPLEEINDEELADEAFANRKGSDALRVFNIGYWGIAFGVSSRNMTETEA
jgi:hypothetical protein